MHLSEVQELSVSSARLPSAPATSASACAASVVVTSATSSSTSASSVVGASATSASASASSDVGASASATSASTTATSVVGASAHGHTNDVVMVFPIGAPVRKDAWRIGSWKILRSMLVWEVELGSMQAIYMCVPIAIAPT